MHTHIYIYAFYLYWHIIGIWKETSAHVQKLKVFNLNSGSNQRPWSCETATLTHYPLHHHAAVIQVTKLESSSQFRLVGSLIMT